MSGIIGFNILCWWVSVRCSRSGCKTIQESLSNSVETGDIENGITELLMRVQGRDCQNCDCLFKTAADFTIELSPHLLRQG